MTTTAPTPRPPFGAHSGFAIWQLIPPSLKRKLGATIPHDARDHGSGTESLVVAVGPGCPVRWLQVNATDSGDLEVRLWALLKTFKGVTGKVCKPSELVRTLELIAAEYGLCVC